VVRRPRPPLLKMLCRQWTEASSPGASLSKRSLSRISGRRATSSEWATRGGLSAVENRYRDGTVSVQKPKVTIIFGHRLRLPPIRLEAPENLSLALSFNPDGGPAMFFALADGAGLLKYGKGPPPRRLDRKPPFFYHQHRLATPSIVVNLWTGLSFPTRRWDRGFWTTGRHK
jgi:hypothetical protein